MILIILPAFIMKDSVVVSDKMKVLTFFNEHFIQSGSLFDTTCFATVKPCTDVPVSAGLLNFTPITKQEVHKALKALNPGKPPGPDLVHFYADDTVIYCFAPTLKQANVLAECFCFCPKYPSAETCS